MQDSEAGVDFQRKEIKPVRRIMWIYLSSHRLKKYFEQLEQFEQVQKTF